MKVEIAIVTLGADRLTRVLVHRVLLECELVETVTSEWSVVRLLEAGAGHEVGDLIEAPTVKLSGG